MARARAPRALWLFKSDPESFGFEHLLAARGRKTAWDGVRNHQVRNFMRDAMHAGDGVLFYHSSAEPTGVAGIARVCGPARPDPTQFDPADEHYDPKSERERPTWLAVEIEAVARFPHFVTLAELRGARALAGMRVLQRGQRLSILPVEPSEWEHVLRLGGLDAADF